MSDSLLNGIKLSAIVAAAALLLFRDAPAFSLPGGLALLLVLFAFDSPAKTIFQSLAFSAAGGFAAAVAFLPLYPRLLENVNLGVPIVDVVWFLAFLAIFLVDRVRSGNAAPVPTPFQYAAAPPPPAYAPVVSSPASSYTPPPPRVPPSPAPQPTLVRDEPPPVRHEPPPPPSPMPPPVAEPVPAEPPAGAVPLKGGKQVDIYVNLLGEGMNMLRSVKAESLGRDYYHIIDTMPANEQWQFTPGQIVRCQKKNLSSGKALVAVDEAPRAQ